MSAEISREVLLYCENMEEIKRRIALIGAVIGGTSLGSENFDYEIVSVQFRKILELIAFSSIVANKEKYSEAHKNFSEHWSAKKILDKVGKINPDFYPKPFQMSHQDVQGVKHFVDVETGFLTRDEFIKLYDLCSKVIHIWNPYDLNPRHVNFGYSVKEWVGKIQMLLKMHYTRLVDNRDLWIVVMSYQLDGKVHVFPSIAIEQHAELV